MIERYDSGFESDGWLNIRSSATRIWITDRRDAVYIQHAVRAGFVNVGPWPSVAVALTSFFLSLSAL